MFIVNIDIYISGNFFFGGWYTLFCKTSSTAYKKIVIIAIRIILILFISLTPPISKVGYVLLFVEVLSGK